MARYFFDIDEGDMQRDEDGTEFASRELAQAHALRILPEIASHEVPNDGDRHAYTVLVTN